MTSWHVYQIRWPCHDVCWFYGALGHTKSSRAKQGAESSNKWPLRNELSSSQSSKGAKSTVSTAEKSGIKMCMKCRKIWRDKAASAASQLGLLGLRHSLLLYIGYWDTFTVIYPSSPYFYMWLHETTMNIEILGLHEKVKLVQVWIGKRKKSKPICAGRSASCPFWVSWQNPPPRTLAAEEGSEIPVLNESMSTASWLWQGQIFAKFFPLQAKTSLPQQLLNPPTCHANVCVDTAKQFCVQNKARLLKMTQLLWPPKPLQPKLFCWLSTCSRWKLGPAKAASVFTTKNQKQWNSESSQSCCLQPLSNQVSSWPCTIKVWDPDLLNSEGFQHDLQCWVICTCFVAIYRHQKSHSKQHSIQRLIT